MQVMSLGLATYLRSATFEESITKNGVFRPSGAPFRGGAAGSAAARSRQSLVSSCFATFPQHRTRCAAPGRGSIVFPWCASCEPLPCRCPPGAEGIESPVLTPQPRFPRQYRIVGHIAAACAVRSGRETSISRIWAKSWLLRSLGGRVPQSADYRNSLLPDWVQRCDHAWY
jgi:hypothetical protein